MQTLVLIKTKILH